jgi:hypothetical protein
VAWGEEKDVYVAACELDLDLDWNAERTMRVTDCTMDWDSFFGFYKNNEK